MRYTLVLRDQWREASWSEEFPDLFSASERVNELDDSAGWVWALYRPDGTVAAES